MAHYLLTTVGSAGDVFPMLAIGQGLKRRGHAVTFLYNPYFEDAIQEAGLEFVPLGTRAQFEGLMTDPDIWHPIKGFYFIMREAVVKFMAPVYDALAGYDPAETVLVSSGLAAGTRLAQEKLGFRLATVHLQSAQFLSAENPAESGGVRIRASWPLWLRKAWFSFVERFVVDRALAPDFNKYRAALGLPPAERFFSRWMHSPDMVLGLWPNWYSPVQPDWPRGIQLTGFVKYESGDRQVPPEIEAFLNAGSPPIVFTPGSAMQHGDRFFHEAVGAAGKLGRRAILLSRFDEHIPSDLPESAVHARWLPLSRVLPRAAAMVHHGGIGTTAQVLNAGIPHLVMPLAHDQPDNANILKSLGVGDRLDPRKFRADRAAEKLGRLLGNADVNARAAELAGRVDFDGSLAATCDHLERLALRDQ